MKLHHFLDDFRRLHPLFKVIIYLVAYFLLALAANILATFIYFSLVFYSEGTLPAVPPVEIPIPLLFLSSMVSLVIAVPLTWAFREVLDRVRFLDLGLRLRRDWLAEIGIGILLGFLLIGFIFIAGWLIGWVRPIGLALDRWPSFFAFLLIFVGVGITEELIFRGYTLQTLLTRWGPFRSLVVSSLIFSTFHGLNPGFFDSLLPFLGIFLAGMLMGYGYLATRSLWLPMALHFAWNFAEGAIFSFPVSGLPSPGLIVWQEGAVDPSWSGGDFGPEGGILGLFATFVGILLLWLLYRQAKSQEPS